MPFLTDLDSRAAIKGSRDPLGLVPVWSRFGRQVVGNLTTVSSSVRGFTTLLLGYYFAEAVHDREGDRSQSTLNLFLKFEQLAGYCRWHVNEDDDFRGRDRVVAKLQKGSKITLGSDPATQILSNQKVYGLWGLFSAPAKESGLLSGGDDRVLTPIARDFVEKHYVSRLTKDGFKAGRQIVDLLRREHADVYLDGRDAALARSVAAILQPEIPLAERAFYDRHLSNGGEQDRTQGRQPLLADLLAELPLDTYFDTRELEAVKKRASRHPDGQSLAEQLERIGRMETLLVPMANAFAFLLTRDRQTLDSVAGEIQKTWGPRLKHVVPEDIAKLRPNIAAAFHDDGNVAGRFVDAAAAFAQGAYADALRLLLEHNAYVMYARNGSQPWARLENGKLDVRYRDELGVLIPGDELPGAWRNTYFINSLKTVVTTLEAA